MMHKILELENTVDNLKMTTELLRKSVKSTIEDEFLTLQNTSEAEKAKKLKENANNMTMQTDTTVLLQANHARRNWPSTGDNSDVRGMFRGPTIIKRQTPSPTHVAFSAYLSHNIAHLALGHTIKCDQIIINDANAYSHYTGVFTVPRSGVYLLTYTFDVNHDHRYEGVKLMVNNRFIVGAIAEENDNKQAMGGNTAIVRMTMGEKVWLESYYARDGELISDNNLKLTTFSGVLLY